MICECALRGLCESRRTILCEKHGVTKGVREQEICNGTSGLPDRDVAAWIGKWEQRDADSIVLERTPKTTRSIRSNGPPPTFDCDHRSELPLIGEALADVCGRLGISLGADGSALCDLCSGRGKPFAVYGCDLHGACSMGRKHSKLKKTCATCEDCTSTNRWLATRISPTGILGTEDTIQRNLATIRAEKAERFYSSRPVTATPFNRQEVKHLLYHFHPITVSRAAWMRHVEWLRDVRHDFNGRFIIGVTTKGGADDPWEYVSPDEIADLVGGEVEIVTGENSRILGEGVTFLKMLEKIRTTDPNHVFFYGHTKGVMRDAEQHGEQPHWWAEVMFDVVFRRQHLAMSALERSAICGAFRMPGGYPIGRPGVGPYWFFSGTMFAARCADVFTRNWNHLPQHYGCVEQWPRMLFRIAESECLFFDNVNNLYDRSYWESQVWPAYRAWKEQADGVAVTA